MVACLPFSYYVEKKPGEEVPKLYIKYFSDCANYFSEKVKKYVNDKADNKIALEQINGQDPFDYIQNFGKPYVALRNPHAQFSIVKSIIHSFPLFIIPYNASELKMEFKFEGIDEPLNIDYYIYMPNFRQMNHLLSSNILVKEEFDEFYEKERKKYVKAINMPNIFDMIKKYKQKKGLLLEDENSNEKITWDFMTTNPKGIKCRVDTVIANKNTK